MNYVNILAQFSKADELREVWHSIKLNKKNKVWKRKKLYAKWKLDPWISHFLKTTNAYCPNSVLNTLQSPYFSSHKLKGHTRSNSLKSQNRIFKYIMHAEHENYITMAANYLIFINICLNKKIARVFSCH